jgi:hypothetical protein
MDISTYLRNGRKHIFERSLRMELSRTGTLTALLVCRISAEDLVEDHQN